MNAPCFHMHVPSSSGVHNICGEHFRDMQKQHVYVFKKHTHTRNERNLKHNTDGSCRTHFLLDLNRLTLNSNTMEARGFHTLTH